ncbi:MAG: hypothetical protein ACK559_14705, partial [bacterium]
HDVNRAGVLGTQIRFELPPLPSLFVAKSCQDFQTHLYKIRNTFSKSFVLAKMCSIVYYILSERLYIKYSNFFGLLEFKLFAFIVCFVLQLSSTVYF